VEVPIHGLKDLNKNPKDNENKDLQFLCLIFMDVPPFLAKNIPAMTGI
jgi:hypothetical protein